MKKQILLDNLEQLETREYTKLTPILVPEKWEELKELCKEFGEIEILLLENNIYFRGMTFRLNGNVEDFEGNIIGENRTPAQMWQIIKNLIGEE